MKYHIGKDGTPKRCRATKACPYGSISDHFNTVEEGQAIADDLNEQLQNAKSFGIAKSGNWVQLDKETEFAEQFKIIDPQGIAVVRQYLLESIATACQDRLFRLYQENQCGAYRVVAEDIDKRALRNVCLSYLAFTDQGEELVSSHYEQADNMTDTLAALTAATKAQLACQEELLADFEAQWSHDGLVMDKWFALQATRPDDDVLAIVEKLMAHPSFNFNNPNRVRALVGAFASQNPKAFHAVDGSGYRFLVEVLIKLNESNPQVAARLIEPLIKLSRYDNQRQ